MARRDELARAQETVAVVGGTGALGFGLTLRWALADVPVVIGSRSSERAAEAAEKVRERATEHGKKDIDVEGLQNDEAVKRAGTVVLAVPFRNQSEYLNNLGHSLSPEPCLSMQRSRWQRRSAAAQHARSESGRDLRPSRRRKWRHAG